MVELAEVNEEAFHPLLCDGVALIPLLFLAFVGQSSLIVSLFDRILALIVVEHTAKLEEHHTFDEFFAVDPVELAYQFGKDGI